jgi:hypothetical protein
VTAIAACIRDSKKHKTKAQSGRVAQEGARYPEKLEQLTNR